MYGLSAPNSNQAEPDIYICFDPETWTSQMLWFKLITGHEIFYYRMALAIENNEINIDTFGINVERYTLIVFYKISKGIWQPKQLLQKLMDDNQNDQLNWLIKIINFIKKNKNNKHIINKIIIIIIEEFGENIWESLIYVAVWEVYVGVGRFTEEFESIWGVWRSIWRIWKR